MAFSWLTAPSTAESASWSGATLPGGGDRAQRAASVAARQPNAPPDGCYRCQQEISISFFFDGFGHTAAEGAELSNIGRLFHTHETTDEKLGIYKVYIEGMGRDLSNDPTGIDGALGKNIKSQTEGWLKSQATGAAKKGATDAAKKIAADWKGGDVTGKVKSSMMDAFNPKKIAENLSKAATYVPMIVSATAKVVADSYPPIRDSEIAAAYMGTGFAARVDKATFVFKQLVASAKVDPRPLKTIRVSMFGFDRGGVIARKFANDLVAKVCKKQDGAVTYQGIRVQFDYMGLVDCVSSAYADSLFSKVLSPVLSFVPGDGWVAKITTKGLGILIGLAKQSLGQYDVPVDFKRVTHHVAATELRFYKDLDSPRDSKNATNLVEVVYPGSQADVGGGFIEGEESKSSELARVALQNMLNEGWSYGVPLRRLDQLKAEGLLSLQKEIAFQKTVNVGGKDLNVGDLFAAYTAQLRAGGRAQLEHHMLAHQKLFVSWARVVHDRTHGPSQGDLLFVNTVDSNVYSAIFDGPVEQYDTRAAYYDRVDHGTEQSNAFYQSKRVDGISDPTVRELATAWVNPAKLTPEVIAFFDHFVHNTITRLNNVSLGDGVFMQLRTIDDAGAMGRIKKKAGDTAKSVGDAISEAYRNTPPEYWSTF
ncbi:DUF2235 domain-containing protein [Paraburkholderia bannensis]|uniref:DUF2235 domain-containing protein n=1 Tax=Paraburkholderia bannensis TaxID=765414 RepID=UPI002AB7F15C|nr:DUF2235 domain-containing protein [Paraburkholderia bannensis]